MSHPSRPNTIHQPFNGAGSDWLVSIAIRQEVPSPAPGWPRYIPHHKEDRR